ncbi:unnamed protein product, partial [Urochloa humidicola]
MLDPKERKKMKDRERARARRVAMSLDKREEMNKKRRDSYHGTEVMILQDYSLQRYNYPVPTILTYFLRYNYPVPKILVNNMVYSFR